jgi:hypothetical protein
MEKPTVVDSCISHLRIVRVMRDSKKNPGKKFPDYFAIFMTEGSDGSLNPVKVTIDGVEKNRTIKCHILAACLTKLTNEKVTFPCDVAVDDTRKEREGVADYFITIDKDTATNKPRLDKNGNIHYVLVLEDYLSAVSVKSMSIDDFLKGKVK